MAPPPPSVIVLLPVYDDWRALERLLPAVAERLSASTSSFGVLVVDDGSPAPPAASTALRVSGAAWVRILRLRRNVGHQRAIAIGLAYIDEQVSCDAVIVMDADGEDRPEDLDLLLEQFETQGRSRIVFAARARRAESLSFRVFYWLYQVIHRLLTGGRVRIGNFSVIPRARVSSLVAVSELWIHYAAAAVRSRQPMCTVPCQRGRRIDGRSHMGFVSLVVHGLSAISAYSDVVFTRLVVGAALLAGFSLVALAGVIGVRVFTSLAIPGWATVASGLLLLVLLQAAMFAVGLTFQVLGSRQFATVLPRRDYSHYVLGLDSTDAIDIPKT
jgi:hypothetical protein